MIVPWWTLAGFAALGALPTWWLVEMEGFGGDIDDDSDTDEEIDSPNFDGDELGRSDPVGIDGNPPKRNATQEDQITSLSDPTKLSKTVSHSSGSAFGPPLRRMSSPIGLKESVGPGGNANLRNGLGHSNSGFGSGGTSYH